MTDPFTQAERAEFQRITDYFEMTTVSKDQCVRWQISNALVEEDLLDDFYQHGYISRNQLQNTLNQIKIENSRFSADHS